jgi:hypothetical protein
MTGKNTSIGPSNAWLPLDNEQTAGEKCSWWHTNALQFWVIRMNTYTTQHKVDFGCTAFETVDYATSATVVNKSTGVVGA